MKYNEKINENIINMRSYFINDKLPINRLNKKSIVIHVRLGDDLTNGIDISIINYNTQILKLIDILKNKYPEYEYHIHSDGYPSEIINKIDNKITFYNKTTPVLETLSDFIHCNILICGNSSFSKVCSYFGNKELIIVHDDNDHSMPDNSYTITSYLQTYSL